MSALTTARRLSEAVSQATRSANFCVAGCLPAIDPGIDVDGMVASLVVVLANPFGGGALVVRHGAARQTFDFAQAAQGKAPCYAAFYADCEHEVQRVTAGVRICLAYNLVLRPKRDRSAPEK